MVYDKKGKYSSIQLSPKAVEELKKKKKDGETYEQMLTRKGLL
jgi:hypothetical protein